MRKELEKIDNQRDVFTGIFERTGWKSGYKGDLETVLLTNIRNKKGEIVSDHLWFNLTKGFKEANLTEGDKVIFAARVKEYQKGYKGRKEDVHKAIEYDYKLSHPSKIKKIDQREIVEDIKDCILSEDCFNVDEILEEQMSTIDDLPFNLKFDLFKFMYVQSTYGSKLLEDKILELCKFNIPESEKELIKQYIKTDKVIVYRGCNDSNSKEDGHSYSLIKKVAEMYAFERVKEGGEIIFKENGEVSIEDCTGGYVIEKEIDIKDIIFFNRSYIETFDSKEVGEFEVFIK